MELPKLGSDASAAALISRALLTLASDERARPVAMRAMCQLWEVNFRVEERLGHVLAPSVGGSEPLACVAARALVIARVCARAPSVGREYLAALQARLRDACAVS